MPVNRPMFRSTFRKAALSTLLLVGLTACGDKQAATEDAPGKASGEVLEGTISDAMLPVDRLKSQPPLLEEAPAASASADGEAAGSPAVPDNAPAETPSAPEQPEASPDTSTAPAEE